MYQLRLEALKIILNDCWGTSCCSYAMLWVVKIVMPRILHDRSARVLVVFFGRISIVSEAEVVACLVVDLGRAAF